MIQAGQRILVVSQLNVIRGSAHKGEFFKDLFKPRSRLILYSKFSYCIEIWLVLRQYYFWGAYEILWRLEMCEKLTHGWLLLHKMLAQNILPLFE